MCGRLLSVLLAVLTALVLGAGAVSATPAPAGWIVTPGGPFTGDGGPVDGQFMCANSQFAGAFTAGDGLGFIDELSYQDCSWGGPVDVDISPWVLQGVAHADGVTSIDIVDIAAHLSGPGCQFEVAGSAATTYDNATSVLTVHNQNTMITAVDPVDNCFGLISEGEHVSPLSDSYVISPPQIIEPGFA